MKAIKRLLGLGGRPEPLLRVLMVCSGNICRSPTAEAVLRAKLEKAGLADRIAVDSAGTQGLHAKEPPDPRAQVHARKRGYELSALRARKIVVEDFMRFQHILAMDKGHVAWLTDKAPLGSPARVGLIMASARLHRNRSEVPDPYYGSDRDFELVLDLVEDACDGLVDELQQQVAVLEQAGRGNA